MLNQRRLMLAAACCSALLLPNHATATDTLSFGVGGLVSHAEESRLSLRPASSTGQYSLTAEVFEYQPDGSSAPSSIPGAVSVVPATTNAPAWLKMKLPHPGLYLVSVTQKDAGGGIIAEARTWVARLLTKPKELLSDFGVVTHFAQGKGSPPTTLSLVTQAGFGRIRDELYWEHIEQRAGEFNFPPAYDQYIKTAKQFGVKPLIVLDYGNARAYPNLFGGVHGKVPRSPEQQVLFSKYVSKVVQRYKYAVKDWEIWNEPKPEEFGDRNWVGYTGFARTVAASIKQQDPQANVIACGGGGAGGGPGGTCIGPMLQAGAASFVDGFSIHPYMAPYDPDNGYEAKNSPIPRVNVSTVGPHLQRMIANGRRAHTPSIWATEVGWYSSPTDARTNEMLQAGYIARLMLEARRFNQVKATFWYDFQDDGSNKNNKEHNFGLIRADYSPKPAYVAAATTAATIGTLEWSGAMSDTPQEKIYAYGPNHSVIAAWSTAPDARAIDIPVTDGRYVIRDWQGQETAASNNSGRIKVRISALPVFLVRK